MVKSDSDVVSSNSWVSLGDDLGMVSLNDLEYRKYNDIVYFVVRDLKKDAFYDIPFRVYKENGSKSNVVSINFTAAAIFLSASNKSE